MVPKKERKKEKYMLVSHQIFYDFFLRDGYVESLWHH